MKKILALILTLGVFNNLNIVGFCIKVPETAINSIYLSSDSWIITMIKSKIKGKYKLADDWENKVAVLYNCVSTNMSEVIDINLILEKNMVNLNIPLNTAQNRCKILSCTLTFVKPIDDLIEMLNNNKKSGNAKLEILNPISNCLSDEIEKIETKLENIGNFKLDDDTKIYPINIGKAYQGHILKDSNNEMLFWCIYGDSSIQKDKFYEVSKVLELYNKKLTQIQMMKKL